LPPDDERFAKLTPIKKVPLLALADGWKIPESTIIIEYLDTHFSTGTHLIPQDRDQARQTRFHDRIADLYITGPLMTLLFERGDAAAAHAHFDAMLTGFDEPLGKRAWVMGDAFTMADSSLIPALRYARELHPFGRYKHVTAFFARARAAEREGRVRRGRTTLRDVGVDRACASSTKRRSGRVERGLRAVRARA
jgi:glutathione S-transferase